VLAALEGMRAVKPLPVKAAAAKRPAPKAVAKKTPTRKGR